MADTIESPTIEQPTTPPPVEIDTKALLDELSKIGVKKPEDLANIHAASRESGNSARLLGEARAENERLQQAVRELQILSQVKQREPDYGNQTEGVDLGKLLDTKLDAGIKRNIREMRQQEFEANRVVQREYYSIINDEDFLMVKPIWEKHIASFETQERLRNGETTMTKEFDRTKITYLKELAIRGRTALEGQAKNSQKQPHMETGDTQSKPIPSGDQEHNKKVRQITEDRSKGSLDSNRALENLVKEFFPADMFKI